MRNDDSVVVDRRPSGGRSILWWILPLLLLLLIAIGLLYYFMIYRHNKPASTAQTSNTAQSSQPSSQAQTTPDTVTDLSTLLTTSDTSTLIGKKVSLPSAVVNQVIGDKSFTLGSSTDHVYAILSDQLNSGQSEQAVQVTAGETRSIQGTVTKAPSDMTALMNQFQLTQAQADELKSRGFYISVTQTSVVNNSDEGSNMPTGAGTE